MARPTYTDVATTVIAKNDGLTRNNKFIVCPPVEDDEALTVYPPRNYYDDHGVDVFITAKSIDFWIDGFKARQITEDVSAEDVAAAIISELDSIQAEYVAEFAA